MNNINKIAEVIKEMTYSEIVEFSDQLKPIVCPIYDAEMPEVIAKNLNEWADEKGAHPPSRPIQIKRI